MGKYVRSELIKNKKSFDVKMLVIMPCVTVVLAILMMSGNYVQMLAYNWWYLIFLPFVVSYVGGHLIHREKSVWCTEKKAGFGIWKNNCCNILFTDYQLCIRGFNQYSGRCISKSNQCDG